MGYDNHRWLWVAVPPTGCGFLGTASVAAMSTGLAVTLHHSEKSQGTLHPGKARSPAPLYLKSYLQGPWLAAVPGEPTVRGTCQASPGP